MTDSYEVLGITRDASEKEIKTAYRKMASKHHPDKEGGDVQMFQKIQAAYDELTKPNVTYVGTETYAKWGFYPKERKHYVYQITLYEAYHGGVIRGDFWTVSYPRGVRNNAVITAKNGDTITIKVSKHPVMERSGDDVIIVVSMDSMLCMLGTWVELDTFDGNKCKVKIPAGTKRGDKFRISAKGFPNPAKNSIVGDLYIVISDVTIEPTTVAELKKRISNYQPDNTIPFDTKLKA